jgi:hypothetical protein
LRADNTLPPDEKLKLIEESQRRIFQNNQSYKRDITESQVVRTDGLIDKIADGTASFKDLDVEMAIPPEQGGIPKKVLLVYQKALQTGVTKDLNKMLTEKTPDKDPTQRSIMVKKYNDLIDMFIDDKTDQWKAKETLANAYADGIVSPQEQKFLNSMEKNLKDISFNRSTSPIASAIKGIKSFFGQQSNATDEEIAFNIKQLLGGVASGDTPEIASKKVLGEYIKKKIPDYPTYPKEGKVKIDKNGNKIRVYPDGTYIEEKANE